jgi:hypothetical protein
MDSHPCSICGHPATQKCAGCKKVYYCSKKHQKEVTRLSKARRELILFRDGWNTRISVKSIKWRFLLIQVCPLIIPQRVLPYKICFPCPLVYRILLTRGTYCGLCGKRDALTRTECCNRTICDDLHLYKSFSFSGASCNRNHNRYTVCGNHFREGHNKRVDWRNCTKCKDGFDSPELYAAQGTSNHNFIQDAWNAPEFDPTECEGCHATVMLNAEQTAEFASGVFYCQKCTSRLNGYMPGKGPHYRLMFPRHCCARCLDPSGGFNASFDVGGVVWGFMKFLQHLFESVRCRWRERY